MDYVAEAKKGNLDAHQYFEDIKFNELVMGRTLGQGAFGRVKLVTHNGKSYALKMLTKTQIVTSNLQGHVINERAVMMVLTHPFILRLHNTYKDKKYLYFLLEIMRGGELFTVLRKQGRFMEADAMFYAGACMPPCARGKALRTSYMG